MALSFELSANAERVSDLFSKILLSSLSEKLVETMTDSEITLSQLQVLRYIQVHRNVTIGDIARGIDISYPSATNMVHRLARKTLVKKDGNPKDRRLVKVNLTNKGNDLVNQMAQERAKRFNEVLSNMDEQDRCNLLKGMTSFVETSLDMDVSCQEDICLRCGVERDPNCPVSKRQGLEFCK